MNHSPARRKTDSWDHQLQKTFLILALIKDIGIEVIGENIIDKQLH